MKRSYILLAILLTVFNSCTELDETLYSTLEADNYYKNENECILAMGNAYTQMQYRATSLWGLMGIQLVTTDEAIIPYRIEGSYLSNNGTWLYLYNHEFYPTLDPVGASWEFSYNTISSCNQVIYEIENAPVEFDTKPNMIAELKVLRAFAYYVAIDLYGTIPITLDFEDISLPKQYSRKEAFGIIEQEIINNLDLLDKEPNTQNYGRCTQAMAYTTLAKMYINAEKWIGVSKWQEAIDACEEVIKLGYYSLETDYFSNFAVENEASKENIFVLPYDRILGWGFQLHQYTLHPSFADGINTSAPLWNGMSTNEEFYNLYDSADYRINSWLVGPQYDQMGMPLLATSGEQLEFTPEIVSLTEAGEGDGARCQKWEYPTNLQLYETMDNDWVFFRYADVLLLKAEAIMRMNNGTPNDEAIRLVNEVRERAFGDGRGNYTGGTLTLDELLNERGREFAWEGIRRQDLIRFGEWGKAWFNKDAEADAHTELLPIPSSALATNPNLTQNPGY